MKHSFLKTLALTVILIFSITGAVYAAGSKTDKLVEEFNKRVEEYETERETLLGNLELAYDKNDGLAYRQAKNELRALAYPTLTEEESNAIEESLEKDDYETANWLYTNSRYYKPVVSLKSEGEHFNYSQKISVNPGTSITLPYLYAGKGTTFKGWETEDKSVFYKAGDIINMPVSDTTLYAVFEQNAD